MIQEPLKQLTLTRSTSLYDRDISGIVDILQRRQTNPRVIARVQSVIDCLLAPVIDMAALRELCRPGLPEQSHRLRMYCWMVLLEILPPQRSKWDEIITKQQRHFSLFVEQFMDKKKYPNFPYGQKYSRELPEWKQLEEDYMVWEQIEKDTLRTHSELAFFSTVYEHEQEPFFKTGARKEKEKMIRGNKFEDALATLDSRVYRYDVMTKLLFVISKFNSKLKYVQGMNEILAPIFYVCNLDQASPQQGECLALYMKVVTDLKQLHMKQFDKLDVGLQGKLNRVQKTLMVVDYELWKRLKTLEITPFYYAFKWVTLFFGQEFQLFDTLRLWDHIFTFPNRNQYIDIVCVAILQCKRNLILKNEFTVVLQALQNNLDVSVLEVIQKAQEIYSKVRQLDIPYESQLIEETERRLEAETKKMKSKKKNSFLKKLFE